VPIPCDRYASSTKTDSISPGFSRQRELTQYPYGLFSLRIEGYFKLQ